MKPIKCYAVTHGNYSDYTVEAIYRRREDAEERAEANNSKPEGSRERESRFYDLEVEEFDYYEGEELPQPLEG